MKQKKHNKSMEVNQTKIKFTKKSITAWGGISSLIAKFLERIEFKDWVKSNIPIKETSNNGKGIYEKVLGQFFTVLAGGYRFAHMSWWGHGREVLMKTFGVEWLPSVPSALTRLWDKISLQSQAEMLGNTCRTFAKRIVGWEGIKEDNLNLDSTVITLYGEQQGAKKGYNPKKPGRLSHHPAIAFLGSGFVVNLWNRAGNTNAGERAREFFEQTLKSLGQNFKVKKVLCDSGFYLIKFIEYIEQKGFKYIISVPMAQIIQRMIMSIKSWERVSKGIEVAEFRFKHTDPKWKKERKYVVVRQSVNKRKKALGKQGSLFKEEEDWKEYRMNVMVTNDEEGSPVEIWREYRTRAKDENGIKKLREEFGLRSFNKDNFWSTEAVMVMNALVFHNLIHYLNRNIFNVNTPCEHIKTLRSKYFIIPGLLGSEGKYNILRLGVRDKKLKARLIYFMERIACISHTLNCNAINYG
ncbi:MAG: transposase [Thermodesulfobacteriota bacterium]|nr:transposase [Thermodesulfobacteriota bacterium]